MWHYHSTSGFPRTSVSRRMGPPHGGGQDPSHCPSQEETSRGTWAALVPRIGHIPGDGDGHETRWDSRFCEQFGRIQLQYRLLSQTASCVNRFLFYYYFGYSALQIVDEDAQKYIFLLLQIHCIRPFTNTISCSIRCLKPPGSRQRWFTL